MQRRQFLKNNMVLLTGLPVVNLPTMLNPIGKDVYKSTIGEFKCTIFRDLMFKYAAKDYFINAEKVVLNQALKTYQIQPDNIPSPYIAMLLERGDQKILIDSGIGFSESPIVFRGKEFVLKGKLQQLLKEEGILASSITDVIITHFHPDHIGGLITGDNTLNFPNATFHMHEVEWNFWHTTASEGQPPLFKFFIERNITPLKNQKLNLLKGKSAEILPGIEAVQAAGHTPGQIALIIGSKGDQLVYISDAFLHPLHIEQLDWQTNYDLDHKKAKKTREKLLKLAYKNDMRVNAFHFDFPGMGRIDKVNKNWKWVYATE